MEIKEYTDAEWEAEGARRFGESKMNWRFVCPSCGYVASVKDWLDAGANYGAVAFSCIGRYTGSKKEMGDKTGGPCNYTNGGLFNISKVKVISEGRSEPDWMFDFADDSSPQFSSQDVPTNEQNQS